LRVVFFGSPDFSIPSLEAMISQHQVVAVVTQPDRPSGRGGKIQSPPVKELAVDSGLHVFQPLKLRDGLLAHELSLLAPDVFVVVAYGRILPPDLLAIPVLGPWNVHASILPKFRGAAPIQWAVIRGEIMTGVSIMRMEEGLDTGPIAAKAIEMIREEDTAGSLAKRLAILGAHLLSDTLVKIGNRSVHVHEQDHSAASFAPPLTKSDGQLDFSQPSCKISSLARGVDPWPGATITLKGEKIKVFGPKCLVTVPGRPGEVLGSGPDGLIVSCCEGAIAFAELQIPGHKRMPAKALLAGHPISPGTILNSA
jgi:methionyl-tRNA formyltransferase